MYQLIGVTDRTQAPLSACAYEPSAFTSAGARAGFYGWLLRAPADVLTAAVEEARHHSPPAGSRSVHSRQ
jgi:hypothetical protein